MHVDSALESWTDLNESLFKVKCQGSAPAGLIRRSNLQPSPSFSTPKVDRGIDEARSDAARAVRRLNVKLRDLAKQTVRIDGCAFVDHDYADGEP